MPDNEEEIQHLQKLLLIYKEQLSVLELQEAMFGSLHVPLYILNQIDEIKSKIQLLKEQLTLKKAIGDSSDSNRQYDPISNEEIIDKFLKVLEFSFQKYYSHINQVVSIYYINSPQIHPNLPINFPVIVIFDPNIQDLDLQKLESIPKKIGMSYDFGLVLAPDCFITELEDRTIQRKASQQVIQERINRLIRPAMKTDLIVIGRATLEEILNSREPRIVLLRTILREIELTRLSPFMAGGALVDRMFFGREGELKNIAEAMPKTSVAITCGRRIGKTTLLNRLAKVVLRVRGYQCYFLNCQPVHNYTDFLREMANVWNRPDLPFNPDEPNSFAQVAEALGDGKHPPIFLLDEIDTLFHYDQEHGERLFKQFRALSMAGKARFIVTGERSIQMNLQNADSSIFNFFGVSVRLSFLELSAVNKLIIEPLSELQVDFEEPLVTTDAIYQATSGHPYLVQRLCQGIVEIISRTGRRIITNEHVEYVLNDRKYQDDYFDTVWGQAPTLAKIITMIVGAGGQTMKEIQDVLTQHGIEPSLKELKNALDILDLYSVMIRKQGRYHFIATAFPDMLKRSYGDDLETNILVQCEEYQWEHQSSNTQAH